MSPRSALRRMRFNWWRLSSLRNIHRDWPRMAGRVSMESIDQDETPRIEQVRVLHELRSLSIRWRNWGVDDTDRCVSVRRRSRKTRTRWASGELTNDPCRSVPHNIPLIFREKEHSIDGFQIWLIFAYHSTSHIRPDRSRRFSILAKWRNLSCIWPSLLHSFYWIPVASLTDSNEQTTFGRWRLVRLCFLSHVHRAPKRFAPPSFITSMSRVTSKSWTSLCELRLSTNQWEFCEVNHHEHFFAFLS